MSDAMLRVWIPGDPVPAERPYFGAGGRVFVRKRSRDYKELLTITMRAAAKRAKWNPEIATTVLMEFFRATRRHTDLDNLAKNQLDAGNGVLWTDDAQITTLTLRKFVGCERPGVTIQVSA